MEPDPSPTEWFDIKIRILGGDYIDLSAPGDMTISELLREVIEAAHLPTKAVDAHSPAWRLENKLYGRECNPKRTVAEEVGRQTGAELFLTRAVFAG